MQIFVSENRPEHLIGEEGQPDAKAHDIKKEPYTANLFFHVFRYVCMYMYVQTTGQGGLSLSYISLSTF